jgi:replicative superfamily II helicase
MMQALSDGDGVACFVAPYIAVGQQVASALRRHVPDDVTVRDLFGSFDSGSQAPTFDAARATIVATPERFDGLLRQGAGFASLVRCVVIDEARLVGNDPGYKIQGNFH